MDDRSLKVLEFDHLLDILKEYSISPMGRRRCEALRPFKDLPEIQSRSAEVLQFKEILETVGEPPLQGLKDIEEVLRRVAIEGSILSVQELLDIYRQMELCKSLKRYFQRLEIEKFPRLQEKISRLSSLKGLEKEILQAVSPQGEILDRASPALSEIRHRLRTTRERAKGVLERLLHQEALQSIFQEQFITVRNGRYVLPVKSDHPHRLKGIVHDQSQSRMTIFLEPLQAVPFNNEVSILTGEEREEEDRILSSLSERVREQIREVERDFEILGEIDFLYATAKISILLRSVQPSLRNDGKVEMKEARHPLLVLQGGGVVIPILLRIGDGIRTLIISGANAGGKTVALKTLGLLTLMVQCGIPIPVAGEPGGHLSRRFRRGRG